VGLAVDAGIELRAAGLRGGREDEHHRRHHERAADEGGHPEHNPRALLALRYARANLL